jgi:4-amino-4-deoxy-L-arabinose transferase-like glycosyltransferase
LTTDRLQHVILPIAIFILAAALRLWNLDATEFKYDEARLANLAAQFVDTGVPPLHGMGSSAGIDNPSLAVYLISLPVLLTRDPLLVTAFVVLLNLAGVWGAYALGRRYWGAGVGLAASTLLAASPWAVFYSRKVWAQDLLLPFVVLTFALLLGWSVGGRRWLLSGTIVALSALTQIHFAALALLPVLAIVCALTLVLRRAYRPLAWWGWPLLAGLGGSVLLYTPYLAFDALHGWGNARALVRTLSGPTAIDWNAVRYALLNVGGREIHALAGPERFREFLDTIPRLNYWPDRIEEGVVLACAAYLAARTWRHRHDRRQVLRDSTLLLWLVGPTAVFLRSRTPVFPHYLLPLYPAPYLVLGIGVSDLFRAVRPRRRLRRPVYGAAGLLGVALVLWQASLSISIFAFVERHDTPGGAGTPIAILRRVSSVVRSEAPAWSSDRVIVYCPGDDPAVDECPAVLSFVSGKAADLRFVDANASLLFPESQGDTLLLVAPGESRAADVLRAYADLLPEETIWLREGKDAYRFYRLAQGQVPRPPTTPAGTPAELENGVQLLGYNIPSPAAPGQTVRLELFWRVAALPPDPPSQGYRFANHLLAASGQRVGQNDGPGYPADRWQAGDTLLSWFDIPVASAADPGPYVLRTGMYVYWPPDQFVPVRVLGKDGSLSDAVEWTIQ